MNTKLAITTMNRNEGFTQHHFGQKSSAGFIALISVIVITLILLTLTAALATKGFLDRFNIIDGENKEVSAGFAASCVEFARVGISNEGADYSPTNKDVCLDSHCTGEADDKKCTIVSVTPATGHRTIQTISSYNHAATRYSVIVDSDDLEIPIISWKEI